MVRRLFPAFALALTLLTGCTSNGEPRNPPAGAASAPSAADTPAAAAPSPSAAALPSVAATVAPPSPTATARAAAIPAAASTAPPATPPTATSPAPAPSAPAIAAPSAPLPAAAATASSPAPQVNLPPVSSGFHIRIPAVGIDAPVVNVGLEPDGSMAAPDGPDIVGWFAPGTRPGQRGNVLLDGHVDWSDRQTGIARTAVFYPLKDMQAGQDIIIDADGRRHTYRVRETVVFAWDDPSALRVLQPTTDAVVTLITCEGAFDRGARNYSHRRVVIAGLVASE